MLQYYVHNLTALHFNAARVRQANQTLGNVLPTAQQAAPWEGSKGKGEGILIPSSDPHLEERELVIFQHQRATQLFSVTAGRGSARKLRTLSPLRTCGRKQVLPRFGLHKTVTQNQSKESDYQNPTGLWANSCAKLQIHLWNEGPPLPASTGKSKRCLEGMLCSQFLTQGKGRKTTVPSPCPGTQLASSTLAFSSRFSHDYPTVTNRTPCKLSGENSSLHKLGFIFGNLVLSQWFHVFIHFAKLSKLRIPYWSIST